MGKAGAYGRENEKLEENSPLSGSGGRRKLNEIKGNSNMQSHHGDPEHGRQYLERVLYITVAIFINEYQAAKRRENESGEYGFNCHGSELISKCRRRYQQMGATFLARRHSKEYRNAS